MDTDMVMVMEVMVKIKITIARMIKGNILIELRKLMLIDFIKI